MSESPTIAARVLMRAERVRDLVEHVPCRSAPPADLSEEKARVNGPLLLEHLRLAIAEWRRPGASPTPQNLSQALMSAEKAIMHAGNEREEA